MRGRLKTPHPGEQSKATTLVSIKASGDCVSVDQLESPTPGFVGQIKGWLTTKWYRDALIYVDHHTQLPFAFMQFSTLAEETMTMRAFEDFAA